MTATTTTDRYPTSLQCWPGGKQLFYSGDPHGDGLMIHAGYDDREGREPTAEEVRTIKVQQLAQRYYDHEILFLDNLVGDLLQAASCGDLSGELATAFDSENVENLRPDPDDWDLEQCKEWIDENGHPSDCPDPNPWAMGEAELREFVADDGELANFDLENLRSHAISEIDAGSLDGIEAWRDAVRDNATDAEVYQWFRVTPWLCSRLREINEVVLDNGYGEWWGRQCCGQSVLMDGTFQRIAEHFVD